MSKFINTIKTLACVFVSLGLTLIAEAKDVSLYSPASVIVDYDPFLGFSGLQDLNIEVLYFGEKTLQARLLITPDTSNSFHLIGSDDPLLFEVKSKDGNFNFNRFQMPVNLTPSTAMQPIKLSFAIPAGQYADAGDMNIDLKIELVDALTSEPISDETIINLVGRVPMRAQTNFAGTSSGFDNGSTYAKIDFGEIRGVDSRTINFQIRGNSDVDISMSSENNGKMVNTETPDASPIFYTVDADGNESDLSVPLEFTRRPAKTLAGSSYPLTVIDETVS